MADGPERGTDDDGETPLESLLLGAVTFLTLSAAFGLFALGVPYFWVAFPVGFGGGIPLAAGLAKYYESRQVRESRPAESDTDAALADLRERYARGELDEAEFEARVERLLETESVADAKDFADRTSDPAASGQRTGVDSTRADEERERA